MRTGNSGATKNQPNASEFTSRKLLKPELSFSFSLAIYLLYNLTGASRFLNSS